MREVWKPLTVKGFEDVYAVSSLGRVKRTKGGHNRTYVGRILKPQIKPDGYHRVILSDGIRKPVYVARLVALAFIPNPTGSKEVNHKNGNRKWDNSVSNLEWNTHQENIAHAVRTNLMPNRFGERNPKAVLNDDKAATIRRLCSCGKLSQREIASMFNVHESTVSDVKRFRTWNRKAA